MNKLIFAILWVMITFLGQLAGQDQSLPDLMVQYEADKRIIQRFYAVPGEEETTLRLKSLVAAYLKELGNLDYQTLSVDAKVDYQLFLRNLKEDFREQEVLQKSLSEAQSLMPFEPQIFQFIKEKRRGKRPDAQNTAKLMNDMVFMIQSLAMKLELDEKIDAKIGRPAAEHLDHLKKELESVHKFYFDYDPMYSWWVAQPYKELDKTLGDYIELIKNNTEVVSNQKKDNSGIVGVPIGNEELLKRLEYEMIPYSPEELIQIAQKEFEWCDREMLKASTELGYGNRWKEALERVKETYVPPGDQPALINRLYEESVAFLKEKQLITIPPLAEETWRMYMMSPERQRFAPFFLGGESIIISYPTSTMTHDEKLMSMRGNNPHFSRATVQHELIPGHGLQQFMTQRYKVYRRSNTPFWTEGWSLYWERLLWDQGFPQSPEDRIGMLFWRMHRCARIIFSLKYHLGEWTPQQCIDFLVDRVGHERANAEGEVRRSFEGGYDPLYQLAYMIGGLQFEALKKELVDSGKMSFTAFHDAILKENNIPVEMVRALLTETPPPLEFKTNWKFYQLNP